VLGALWGTAGSQVATFLRELIWWLEKCIKKVQIAPTILTKGLEEDLT